MKGKVFKLIVLLGIGLNSQAQHLDFNRNGEFKIVQFTDMHINQEKENINLVLNVVSNVVEAEKPDLVVYTGDIVTENNPVNAFGEIAELMKSFEVSWVCILGNHDDEHNAKRDKIAKMLTTLPNCLNKKNDFVLEIGDGKEKALLYLMDSQAYSTLKPRVEGYGWFTNEQVNWYIKTSQKYTQENKGKPLPALAFFHIPLPEYNQVWGTEEIVKIGVKNEKVCCPDINTGMFAAMLEAGDVMGTFVGHDHVNDYIGVLHEIALAYGRCSGAGNAYGDLPPGGRVVVLKEGKRAFETWIREVNGKIVNRCNYPDSFITKK